MRTATIPHTQTLLAHIFGPCLDDDRYLVERFRSMASDAAGPGGEPSTKGQRKAKGEIVSLRAARARRDHRLYRNAPHGRRAVLGRSRRRPVRGARLQAAFEAASASRNYRQPHNPHTLRARKLSADTPG